MNNKRPVVRDRDCKVEWPMWSRTLCFHGRAARWKIAQTTCLSPVLKGVFRDPYLERATVVRVPYARVRLNLMIPCYFFGICTGGFLVLNRQAGTDVVQAVTKLRAGLSNVH